MYSRDGSISPTILLDVLQLIQPAPTAEHLGYLHSTAITINRHPLSVTWVIPTLLLLQTLQQTLQ